MAIEGEEGPGTEKGGRKIGNRKELGDLNVACISAADNRIVGVGEGSTDGWITRPYGIIGVNKLKYDNH